MATGSPIRRRSGNKRATRAMAASGVGATSVKVIRAFLDLDGEDSKLPRNAARPLASIPRSRVLIESVGAGDAERATKDQAPRHPDLGATPAAEIGRWSGVGRLSGMFRPDRAATADNAAIPRRGVLRSPVEQGTGSRRDRQSSGLAQAGEESGRGIVGHGLMLLSRHRRRQRKPPENPGKTPGKPRRNRFATGAGFGTELGLESGMAGSRWASRSRAAFQTAPLAVMGPPISSAPPWGALFVTPGLTQRDWVSGDGPDLGHHEPGVVGLLASQRRTVLLQLVMSGALPNCSMSMARMVSRLSPERCMATARALSQSG